MEKRRPCRQAGTRCRGWKVEPWRRNLFSGSRTGKRGSSACTRFALREKSARVSSPGMLKAMTVHEMVSRAADKRHHPRRHHRFGASRTQGTLPVVVRLLDRADLSSMVAPGFYEWGEGVGAGQPSLSAGPMVRRRAVGRRAADGAFARRTVGARDTGRLKDLPPQLVLLPTRTGERKRLGRARDCRIPRVGRMAARWSTCVFAGRESNDVRRTYVQNVDCGDPSPVTPDGFVGSSSRRTGGWSLRRSIR